VINPADVQNFPFKCARKSPSLSGAGRVVLPAVTKEKLTRKVQKPILVIFVKPWRWVVTVTIKK
jgi:hypothetical protein